MPDPDSIVVICECGQKLRARPDKIGQAFKCPRCGVENVVPDADESAPAMQPPAPKQSKARSSPFLNILSLIIASAALIVALTPKQPQLPGTALNSFNLKTPVDAMRSVIEIQRSANIRAQMQINQMQMDRTLKEKLDTIKVASESEYGGKRILFVTYKSNGIDKQDIESFEKHAESGLWMPTFVSPYSMTDKALEKKIRQWQGTWVEP